MSATEPSDVAALQAALEPADAGSETFQAAEEQLRADGQRTGANLQRLQEQVGELEAAAARARTDEQEAFLRRLADPHGQLGSGRVDPSGVAGGADLSSGARPAARHRQPESEGLAP